MIPDKRYFCKLFFYELVRSALTRSSQFQFGNLLLVVDRFPKDHTMRYNLACYESQLGRLEQARTWLQKAFEMGNVLQLKLMAVADPDLEPLWKGIREH